MAYVEPQQMRNWVLKLLQNYTTTDEGGGTEGTVTSVVAGDGMDFTTITDAGSIVLGTPSSLDGNSINATTATSHTHAISLTKADIGLSNVPNTDIAYSSLIPADDFTQGEVNNLKDAKLNDGTTPWIDSYLPLSGGILTLGEGLEFIEDYSINSLAGHTPNDSRIINLYDNSPPTDGALLITYDTTTSGDYAGEIIYIDKNNFEWLGKTVATQDWVNNNSAGYTHPNHTGQVTSLGDGATALDVTAITDQSSIISTLDGTEQFVINDGGMLCKATIADIDTYIATGTGYDNYVSWTIADEHTHSDTVSSGETVTFKDLDGISIIEKDGRNIEITNTDRGSTAFANVHWDFYCNDTPLLQGDLGGADGHLEVKSGYYLVLVEGDNVTFEWEPAGGYVRNLVINTTTIDKTFIDALNVDADTLDSHDSTYFAAEIDLIDIGGTPANDEIAIWSGAQALNSHASCTINDSGTLDCLVIQQNGVRLDTMFVKTINSPAAGRLVVAPNSTTLDAQANLTFIANVLAITGTVTWTDGGSTNANTAYTHSQVAGGNSVHVSTTENTQWDAAYTHSGVTGTPHVTAGEKTAWNAKVDVSNTPTTPTNDRIAIWEDGTTINSHASCTINSSGTLDCLVIKQNGVRLDTLSPIDIISPAAGRLAVATNSTTITGQANLTTDGTDIFYNTTNKFLHEGNLDLSGYMLNTGDTASGTYTFSGDVEITAAIHGLLAITGGTDATIWLKDTGAPLDNKLIEIKSVNGRIDFIGHNDAGDAETLVWRTNLGYDTDHKTTFYHDVIIDGNVGIGTASPSGPSTGPNFHLQATGDLFPAYRIERTGGSTKTNAIWDIFIGSTGSLLFRDATNTYESFLIQQGAPSYSLLIDSTGNVGIGTSNPDTTLHVYSSTAGYQAIIERSAALDAALSFKNTEDQWTIGIDRSNANAFVISDGTSAGVSNSITFKVGGKVGIGTASPSGKLEVYHNTASQYVALFDQDYATGYGVKIQVDGTGTGSAFVVVQGASNQLFRIQQDGNVGIGTDSPNYKLDVNGTGRFVSNVEMDAALFVDDGIFVQGTNEVYFNEKHEVWQTDAGGSFTWNFDTSRNMKWTSSTSGTLTISNMPDGATGVLICYPSADITLTFPANSNLTTLSLESAADYILTVVKDGTDYIWFANSIPVGAI